MNPDWFIPHVLDKIGTRRTITYGLNDFTGSLISLWSSLKSSYADLRRSGKIFGLRLILLLRKVGKKPVSIIVIICETKL